MCGIVVHFCNHASDRADLEKVLSRISHRGRDGVRLFQHNQLQIGFCRLAINDLTAKGMQPFFYKNLMGVFNAEIYNFRQLIQEFDLKVESGSDTEVILPLFELLGPSIIEKLDGFYAGVIINSVSGEIYAIRDYIGKKSLFWVSSAKGFWLVSELKSLPEAEAFERIAKGVSLVTKGGIEKIATQNNDFAQPLQKFEDLELVRSKIESSVVKRLPPPDLNMGVWVSGGLDSSIIAYVTAKVAPKTFFYTLGDDDCVDNSYAIQVTKALGIRESRVKRVPIPCDSDLEKLITLMVYVLESFNPSILSNGIATYLLAKAAHDDGVKVVLSGEGADELFCGYPISNLPNDWVDSRSILIENLETTELRRLDLASMACTIEVRCPFLDRELFLMALGLGEDELIYDSGLGLMGKKILRDAFRGLLPDTILNRPKTSLDVGSGLRGRVLHLLKKNAHSTEREALKKIWKQHFPCWSDSNPYFSRYPIFDPFIEKRSSFHKNV